MLDQQHKQHFLVLHTLQFLLFSRMPKWIQNNTKSFQIGAQISGQDSKLKPFLIMHSYAKTLILGN